MKEMTREEISNSGKGIPDGICHCPKRKKDEVEGNMHNPCLGIIEVQHE